MRGSGMLLPVASLPSKYGIGSFSKSAYEFVDLCAEAGQKYWQILPLGPHQLWRLPLSVLFHLCRKSLFH